MINLLLIHTALQIAGLVLMTRTGYIIKLGSSIGLLLMFAGNNNLLAIIWGAIMVSDIYRLRSVK